MYHWLSQDLLECPSSETKESAGGLFLFLLAIEGTDFLTLYHQIIIKERSTPWAYKKMKKNGFAD